MMNNWKVWGPVRSQSGWENFTIKFSEASGLLPLWPSLNMRALEGFRNSLRKQMQQLHICSNACEQSKITRLTMGKFRKWCWILKNVLSSLCNVAGLVWLNLFSSPTNLLQSVELRSFLLHFKRVFSFIAFSSINSLVPVRNESCARLLAILERSPFLVLNYYELL